MATQRGTSAVWPEQLASYDPAKWESEFHWRVARASAARGLGFSTLAEIQELTRITLRTCSEMN